MSGRFGVLVVLVLLGASISRAEEREFRIHFDKARLRHEDREVAPVGRLDSPFGSVRQGKLSVLLESGPIRAVRDDGEVAWRVDVPEGWQHLGADGGTAYYWERRPAAKPQIRRLSLASGTWRRPLVLPVAAERRESIGHISHLGDRMLVLSGTNEESEGDARPGHYRITAFEGETAVWSETFRKTLPTNHSEEDFEGRPPFALAGKLLFVVAGVREDLLGLNVKDGSLVCRLPRVWEFERGYIGPSVYEHYIGRFGEDDWDSPELREDPRHEKRREEELLEACRIIGGPVAVRYEKGHVFEKKPKGDREEWRVFVAVLRDERFHGEAGECWIYEITDGGIPAAVIRMPRRVRGASRWVDSGGIAWECEREALARIEPSFQASLEFTGMGGFGEGDCLGNLVWYRMPDRREAEAPFSCAFLTEPRCVVDRSLLRLTEDGWADRQVDGTLHLPISRTSLATGLEERLLLTVPFQGTLPEMPGGSWSRQTAKGWTSHSGGGIQEFAIHGLEHAHGVLEVTVSWPRKRQSTFRFSLAALER